MKKEFVGKVTVATGNKAGNVYSFNNLDDYNNFVSTLLAEGVAFQTNTTSNIVCEPANQEEKEQPEEREYVKLSAKEFVASLAKDLDLVKPENYEKVINGLYDTAMLILEKADPSDEDLKEILSGLKYLIKVREEKYKKLEKEYDAICSKLDVLEDNMDVTYYAKEMLENLEEVVFDLTGESEMGGEENSEEESECCGKCQCEQNTKSVNLPAMKVLQELADIIQKAADKQGMTTGSELLDAMIDEIEKFQKKK